jgi:hypothetical protein
MEQSALFTLSFAGRTRILRCTGTAGSGAFRCFLIQGWNGSQEIPQCSWVPLMFLGRALQEATPFGSQWWAYKRLAVFAILESLL